MLSREAVIDWLLASDASIRWQVMRDLLDAPESEWSAERSKVEVEGWGAELLSHQDEDGQRAGGAFCHEIFKRVNGKRWASPECAISKSVISGGYI
jgi:hypothetical protein